MKRLKKKYNFSGMCRLIRAIYGHKNGVTLKTILKDPETLLRVMRPTLSLDYTFEDRRGQTAQFMEILDRSVILPAEKTLIEQVHEKDVRELTKRTRREIVASWRRVYDYGRDGSKLAAKVFEGLCDGDSQSEIGRSLKVTRERVRQIREQLKKLPVVIKMERELRAMKK